MSAIYDTIQDQYRKSSCSAPTRAAAWCNRSIRDLTKLFYGPREVHLPSLVKTHTFAKGILAILLYLPTNLHFLSFASYRIIYKKIKKRDLAEPQVHKIRQNLYLGSKRGPAYAKANGIRIDKVLRLDHMANPKGPKVDYYIPVHDDIDRDLGRHLANAVTYIRDCHQRGENVLVHCNMGISRSASIVVAYLVATEGLSVQESVRDIKEKRPCIHPNPGFLHQLKIYQKQTQALSLLKN